MNEHFEPAQQDPRSTTVSRFLVLFLTILVVLFAVWAGYSYMRSLEYRRMLETSYLRAVDEASANMTNISTDLVKGMYAGSPSQMSMISSKLWKEASSAKASLSALPVAQLHLDKTYQFLSQVGDYAMYLSRKAMTGREISQQERQQFQQLREYADRLSQQIATLEQQLSTGEITFAQIENMVMDNNNGAQAENPTEGELPSSGGLDAMEQGFSGYPTLIYDGPFSDHLMDKEPEMTKGAAEISQEQALEKALSSFGQDVELPNQREEDSKLPSYVFYSDQYSVAVTKNGGFLCYMTGPKPENIEAVLTKEDALRSAQNYLASLGIPSMKETYYEVHNGIMTINFAHTEADGQITCYTDLIKVDVSMENGDILAFDARGYLVNHKERTFTGPQLTEQQAREKLSPSLTVESAKLALIPTQGQNEVFVYEFKCVGTAGDDVLVYINANTGTEEQILILLENENGALTK